MSRAALITMDRISISPRATIALDTRSHRFLPPPLGTPFINGHDPLIPVRPGLYKQGGAQFRKRP
jgi:hypothetical protein